jgi:hypothetical protein
MGYVIIIPLITNRKENMTNVEVRSIVARVEDMTKANFDLLYQDETFKNMFHLFVKGKNADLKSISQRLSDYANENLI